MKKRKELNALIGLAADGRRKKPAKKGSGHRLLRTEPPASDSESSSEEDEFAGARGRCGKGDYLRCCKFCYPLCAFVILAACVVACVGLVWMQVALKEDLDAIKEKFRTMESNQKTSFQEIPKLNEDLVQKQKQLEQIETGELGLNKIWINITEINKQISLLTSTVNHLKNNIKSASDLISLPLTVEKLQKTVANIGSTLTSVSHDVENIQTAIEEYKKSIEILQNDVKELKQIPSLPSTIVPWTERNQTENCKKESQSLHAALEELNNTVVVYQKLNDIKLLNVDSAIGNLSRRVMLLENSPLAVNNLDKRENLSTNVETGPRDSQVSKLKEKLQLISALTGKPENDKPIETSKNVESSLSTTAKPTDLSRLASRSADDITESNGQLRHLSLPGISSIRDLQNLFEKATEDTGGKLSYEDLQKLLGSTAQESQSFKKFDTDGDEKYSLQELRLALGV
ncbi:PREDICTED: EF-hand calcium-binding domain-containing protein 14 isoform X2 [Haliaeetus leucocephalus]|uniref:EF-hand calcium-binding domain-containing protein 14 isoform X2 n=1 Tax=Haliaeetus leucocephalus TaxID=52644 RepID=UPI00053CE684|nr:PREDICTED: EF-hand calcium-binding domain-containing protein 14 isoform X2 [Haliaeetus leucocephalus]